MPDIAAARPVAGAPIETGWGDEVHDGVECVQFGTVSVTGMTNSVTGSTAVVFPRPYATVPTVFTSCASVAVQSGWGSLTTTGFNVTGRRNDGNATATTQSFGWMAVGKLA